MAEDEREQAPDEPTDKQAAEAEDAGQVEEVKPAGISGVLSFCVSMLYQHAWQSMGLVPNPATGTILKDMDQARVAIDAVAALAPLLEGRVSPSEMREVRTMLSNLQMNFVTQQARGQ